MASLTEVAVFTRKMIRVGVLLLVSFFVLKIGSKVFISYWKAKNPPQPAPPAMRFGKIPKLELKETVTSADITYKLETPTNTLPTLSDRVNVYYSPYSQPSLLALEKARKQALLLGFSETEKKLNEKEFEWQNTADQTTLMMNIYDGTFTIAYDWKQDANLLTNRLPLNEQTARTLAGQTLSRANLLPEDIDINTGITTYLKIAGQQMVTAPSQSEANLIRVDFYRNDIDTLPVKTLDGQRGLIQLVFSGTVRPANGLIALTYTYFPMDYGSKSDYPLNSASALWNQFTAGGGYLITVPSPKPTAMTIRRIYLGYLDTLKPQKFMQPVLFFEGDNGFLGFTPALTEAMLQP